MSGARPDGAPATMDSVVVIRLWREPHDPRARAQLLSDTSGAREPAVPGDPLIGLEAILAAAAASIREFEERSR